MALIPRKALVDALKTHFLSKRGDNNGIQGGLFPDITDTHNLGSATKRWGTLRAVNIIADNVSGGGVADTYLELTDTPGVYTGDANKFVAVNAAVNALEHIDIVAGNGIAKSIGAGTQTLAIDLATPSGLSLSGGELSIATSINTNDGLSGGGALTGDLNLAVDLASPSGLAFNTGQLEIDLQANSGMTISGGLALGSVSTVTLSSTNSITGSSHAHAITTSSNPGAAASILATDSSGGIQLTQARIDKLGINYAYPSTLRFRVYDSVTIAAIETLALLDHYTTQTVSGNYGSSSLTIYHYINASAGITNTSMQQSIINGQILHNSYAGAYSYLAGMYVWQTVQAGAGGTVGEWNGIRISLGYTGANTAVISSYRAVNILSTSVGAGETIQNVYGLFIDGQTVGSTGNYAIYTNAGQNRFGDRVAIYGSQDITQLLVRGFSTQTSKLQEWQNSGTAVVASIDNVGKATVNYLDTAYVSSDLIPVSPYTYNIGSITNKWLTIHAAELWVETLVAQETIATIGGRILVGPTTTLTLPLPAAYSYMQVKHNQMSYGDIGYMEANGGLEFIEISGLAIVAVNTTSETFSIAGDWASWFTNGVKFTVVGSTGNNGEWTVSSSVYSSPNTVVTVTGDITDGTADGYFLYIGAQGTGPFTYLNILRNRDGSGANDWVEGDALFNTGTTGNGFIDLYSIYAVNQSGNTAGPTIVGEVRYGATYNEYRPFWAIGNLHGLYGYGSNDVYGVAFGQFTTGMTSISIDSTYGIRIRNDTTVIAQWDLSGDIILGPLGTEHMKVTSAALTMYGSDGTTQRFGIDGDVVTIGATGAGNDFIQLDPTNGVRVYSSNTLRFHVQADGDLFVGSNVSAPATTAFSVFTNGQTYNGEAVGAGDVLIGDNSSGKPNIFFDASGNKLYFRGGSSWGDIYIDGANDELRFGYTSAGFIEASGIWLQNAGGSAIPPSNITWYTGSDTAKIVSRIHSDTDVSGYFTLEIDANGNLSSGGNGSILVLTSTGETGYPGTVEINTTGVNGNLTSELGGKGVSFAMTGTGTGNNYLLVDVNSISSSNVLKLDGGGIGTGSNFIWMGDGATAKFRIRGDGAVLDSPAINCWLTHNTTQSIGSGSWVALAFNTETSDNFAMHGTPNTRITIPTGFSGWYVLTGHANLAYNATGSARQIALRKNGTTIIVVSSHPVVQSGFETHMAATTLQYLVAGDYVEVLVYQNSGSSLNCTNYSLYSPIFQAVRLV